MAKTLKPCAVHVTCANHTNKLAWRDDMKLFGKTLGLLLAGLVLAGCGGGGGDDGGAFSPPESGTITLRATSTTIPLNTTGAPWYPASPFSTEVDIEWRNADGTFVSGQDLSCSISPVEVASIHIPDDASTPEDESQVNWTNIQVHSDTGHAICWVFSSGRAGDAVLTVSAVDPNTSRTITSSITITVTAGVGPMPAAVEVTPTPSGIYLPESGGNNVSALRTMVVDGAGQTVPDPVSGNSGVDNVQYEIIGDVGDAKLSSTSVGGNLIGTTVTTYTVRGVATASLQAGNATNQGPVQVRVTADRADNNVSNGIQDPVSSTASVIVSDGKLYSVTITSPDVNAININTVSDEVEVDDDGIPSDPDGSYSLTVSALGTDRQGNPVLPGTPIRFGSIDEPVGTPDAGAWANRFLIAGGDGNPQEGGYTFTAPTGSFQTAGGGAGPGDALVVFGKTHHGAPHGNEDLESAVTVQRVNSQTNLTTASTFNNNNTTGATVDYGPVLPYIVGRSQHGNITATALTDEIGVAHATLNYTVETLGHIVAMWAQGDGIDRVTGGSRRVTDAVQLVYPGVAPAQLIAFPSPIPGNTDTIVTVCLLDALNSPIQGVRINFQMDLNGGTGSVDGNGTSGTLDNTTGPDGCVDALVHTDDMPVSTSDSASGQVVFSVGGATAPVDIIVQLAFISNGGVGSVCTSDGPASRATIRAYTTDGSPAAGVAINAACSGVTATPASAVTGANGSATFTLTGTPGASGTCTFSAEGVAPITVSVNIPDGDDFSPPCVAGP